MRHECHRECTAAVMGRFALARVVARHVAVPYVCRTWPTRQRRVARAVLAAIHSRRAYGVVSVPRRRHGP